MPCEIKNNNRPGGLMTTTNTIETRSKSRVTADTFIDHAIVRITGTTERLERRA